MTAALLVIDVQQGLCEGPYAVYDARAVIERINTVSAKARAAGVPVVFVQHESATQLQYGSPAWQLADGLCAQGGDLFVRKTTPDSFFRTDLTELLNARKITRLTICGMQSDFCVDTTTRRAMALGYPVVLVSDAHTTEANAHLSARQIIQHHNDTLPRMESFGARTRTVPANQVSFLD